MIQYPGKRVVVLLAVLLLVLGFSVHSRWAGAEAGCGPACLKSSCAVGSGAACGSCPYAKGSAQCALAKAAATKVQAAGVKFWTASDLSARVKSGQPPILINVLSASSYTKSRLKGSINIPYSDIGAIAPRILPDKSAEIVVYCGSYKCGASIKAAQALKKLGYTNVGDYKGGLREWSALGLPLEGSSTKSKGSGA